MIKVIKIGGNVVDNPEMLARFVQDFASVQGPKVLVHGGGVMASAIQKALGQTPQMIAGRRVTDAETLKVVTMVYAGWCNKNIVALLQGQGCNAMGFCGADGNIITASKRPPIPVDGEMVDYGYVGDVKADSVNVDLILDLVERGITPVLCAINHDGKGNLLNTNADTIASSVARALARRTETDLVFCFEKAGVLSDPDDDSSVIPVITPQTYQQLKADGTVSGGMLPKLENSFKAIDAGVSSVIIKSAENLLNDLQTTLKAEQ